MAGPPGGIQGAKGTFFGIPYVAGSWQDKLIEAFDGSHDMIGGKGSGLYDAQANIKRGMTDSERSAYSTSKSRCAREEKRVATRQYNKYGEERRSAFDEVNA